MVHIEPIPLKNGVAIGVRLEFPKTNVLAISTKNGYLMCGVLDVRGLDEKLAERKIVAARVTGVKTFEDMLKATVQQATEEAKKIGIVEGETTGKEALEKMSE